MYFNFDDEYDAEKMIELNKMTEEKFTELVKREYDNFFERTYEERRTFSSKDLNYQLLKFMFQKLVVYPELLTDQKISSYLWKHFANLELATQDFTQQFQTYFNFLEKSWSDFYSVACNSEAKILKQSLFDCERTLLPFDHNLPFVSLADKQIINSFISLWKTKDICDDYMTIMAHQKGFDVMMDYDLYGIDYSSRIHKLRETFIKNNFFDHSKQADYNFSLFSYVSSKLISTNPHIYLYCLDTSDIKFKTLKKCTNRQFD